MKNYSEQLYQRIAEFLDEDGWKYRFREDNGIICSGFRLENALGAVPLFVDVRSDKYIVFAVPRVKCEPENRFELAEFLTRINYRMIFGDFEMDFSYGKVRFRFPVDCDGETPSDAMIKRSIFMTAAMMNKYGNAICAVMNGVSAEAAFKKLRAA